MNKRKLHHLLVQLRKIKFAYLLIAFVISLSVSVIALRHNNLHAIALRENVLAVDQKNGDVESALRELREYTYSHMNSGLATQNGAYPPIQLKYRYDRLAGSEKERVTDANATLYTQAQSHCEAQLPTGRSLNRIECIQDYITSNGGAAERAIPDSLYKFDFASPLWSPDLAGFSLIATALIGLIIIVRAATVAFLRSRL